MTGPHEIFTHFRGWAGEAAPGILLDWIGSKTTAEIAGLEWVPHSLTGAGAPPVDEEYFEWIDVLEMARGPMVFTPSWKSAPAMAAGPRARRPPLAKRAKGSDLGWRKPRRNMSSKFTRSWR